MEELPTVEVHLQVTYQLLDDKKERKKYKHVICREGHSFKISTEKISDDLDDLYSQKLFLTRSQLMPYLVASLELG